MLYFCFTDELPFSGDKQILNTRGYNFKPTFTSYLLLPYNTLTFITVGETIKEQEGRMSYYVLVVLVTSFKL